MAVIELVINPVAGKGRALRIGEEAAALLKSRGIDFAKHLTDHPRHATELAREAAGRGAETVIAFGGDGTLTETAAGLRHTRTALGVVPAGTGNDFIKTIGTPREWRDALEFILTHPARPVNSGMMNDRFFLNVGGAGFDVMVLDFANAARKRLSGIGSYLYGVLRAISAFRPIPMHVEIGGDVVLDGHYMICSVGNGRFIGGVIAPGVETSASALFSHATKLGAIDLVDPHTAIGHNTEEAIQAGIVYGEADRVDGIIRRIFAQLGYETPVVATGGLASRVAAQSQTITAINPELTLEGLRLVYEAQEGAASV